MYIDCSSSGSRQPTAAARRRSAGRARTRRTPGRGRAGVAELVDRQLLGLPQPAVLVERVGLEEEADLVARNFPRTRNFRLVEQLVRRQRQLHPASPPSRDNNGFSRCHVKRVRPAPDRITGASRGHRRISAPVQPNGRAGCHDRRMARRGTEAAVGLPATARHRLRGEPQHGQHDKQGAPEPGACATDRQERACHGEREAARGGVPNAGEGLAAFAPDQLAKLPG